ncbi:uncharacterized protein BT62DRAFT_1012094 [Guyanagaster necrorhizus]|uniref:Uncharacterized protein n=1 Tax=Guyanagaster necrorhizus TaxID=856835 RepID=A0A9P7VJF5_9AGAR|nr:uncharacterized protein BT62DRAFT_1012094 [Guyanagaster necrorhizus MCA 3950]KAG7441059.1 hypothetical protein BT62DRAFT_1012094 [Guyanagaster necrorhizus MCA 3950]
MYSCRKDTNDAAPERIDRSAIKTTSKAMLDYSYLASIRDDVSSSNMFDAGSLQIEIHFDFRH